jgi:hypothetical protein
MNLILCEDGFVLDLPTYLFTHPYTTLSYLQSFHLSACHYSVHLHNSLNLFERHRTHPLILLVLTCSHILSCF